MTKSEKEYIAKLVHNSNEFINAIYNNRQLSFMKKEQREGFIQGIATTIEPFATFIGLDVVSVDLNRME